MARRRGGAARRYEVERERWLRRFAEAPDPERRELCEDLVAQTVEALARAEQDRTLGEACARARRQQANAMAHAAADLADGPFGVSGLLLGGQATE